MILLSLPPVKAMLSYLGCLAFLAPAEAATVVSSQVWVTYADGELHYTTYSSQAYDNHRINDFDESWKGGSITISLEEGETLLSAYVTGTTTFKYRADWSTPAPIVDTIPLYSGLTGPVTGATTVTLDVWKTGPAGEQNSRTFSHYYPPYAIVMSHPYETAVSFTITTSLGTFRDDNGGDGYSAFYPIPEPGTLALLFPIGFLAVSRRRR